jgi:HEAT repeat protein
MTDTFDRRNNTFHFEFKTTKTEALTQLLIDRMIENDIDDDIRLAAIDKLVESDDTLRESAVYALIENSDEECIDRAAEMLIDNRNGDVIESAAEMLYEQRDSECISMAVDKLMDNDIEHLSRIAVDKLLHKAEHDSEFAKRLNLPNHEQAKALTEAAETIAKLQSDIQTLRNIINNMGDAARLMIDRVDQCLAASYKV